MSTYILKDDYTLQKSNNELFSFYEAINNGLNLTDDTTPQVTKDLYSNYLFIYLMSKFLEIFQANNSHFGLIEKWKKNVLEKKNQLTLAIEEIDKLKRLSSKGTLSRKILSFKKSTSKREFTNEENQRIANQIQKMINYTYRPSSYQIKEQISNQFNSTRQSKKISNSIFNPNDFINFCLKAFFDKFEINIVIFSNPVGGRYLTSQNRNADRKELYILLDAGKYHYLNSTQPIDPNLIQLKQSSRNFLLKTYENYQKEQEQQQSIKEGGSKLTNKYKKTNLKKSKKQKKTKKNLKSKKH